MKRSKRILIYSVAVAVVAAVIAIVLLVNGQDSSENVSSKLRHLDPATEAAYSAVPADAVVVMDFEHLWEILPAVTDTSTFGYGFIDASAPLVKLQKYLADYEGAVEAHTLFSIHYSALNEISFLQITDLSGCPDGFSAVQHYIDSLSHTSRKYNGCDLMSFSNGLNLAISGNLLVASGSVICVESSLRHLANNSSILDNHEFYDVLREAGGKGCMFVNHKQIGKLFSGSASYGFLKYSDFIMRFASWSALDMNARQKNIFSFSGVCKNNGDPINFSSIYDSQRPVESNAGKILPASTVFGVAVQIPSMKGYQRAYQNYLEVNKKLSSFLSRNERVTLPEKETPAEWIVSQGFSEIISAFCLVGNKYEWVTFCYKKASLFKRLASGVKNNIEHPDVFDFEYKGYIGAVLGEAFSHCPEDSYCKIGEWTIIGSKRCISEFASGKANAVKLEGYLRNTPASSFFEEKGNAKVLVNLREGSDTLLTAFNQYFRGRFKESLKHKNFSYATINMTAESGKTIADMNYYAANLSAVPEMFNPELSGASFFIDSTIKVGLGPFTLVDPQTGDTNYLTQSKKWLSIFLSDKNRRDLWGIPFKDTIRGMVDQVVLSDKRTYMAFILSNKLHLMSKKGGYAGGYPKLIERPVVLGPRIINEGGEYRMFVLDTNNIIAKLTLDGEAVSGWNDIHAPEFTHNLPEIKEFFGEKYLILRTVGSTRIYHPNGIEITSKNIRKPIANDSQLTPAEDGYIKVMGVDGKEFLFNLKSGRIKKL